MKSYGHTLMELIIAIAVFGVLLSTLFSIFVPGMKSFMLGKNRAEIQSDLMLSLIRMKRELSSTNSKSVTINSADTYDLPGAIEKHAIGFLSAYKDTTTGTQIQLDPATYTIPIWQKFVIYYYIPDAKEIRRKEHAIIPAPVVSPLTHEKLQNICIDNATYKSSIIARNIKEVSLYRTTPYLVRIEVTATKMGTGLVGKEEYSMKCFIEVYPHNTTE